MRKVYELPMKFSEDFQLVKKGSLGVSPVDCWNQSVKDLCNQINSNKNLDVHFVLTCKQDNLYIGDIYVFSPSGNYSLTERVKECDKTVKSECNFKRIYDILTKSSIPATLVPHERIEMTNQLDLGTISEILLHQSDFKAPPNLIISGKGLKPQWTSADETLFDPIIKREISREKLNEIQMCMWPQMHSSYRHAIIISNQSDYTSLYLPVLLNNVIQSSSNHAKPEFMGPIAIIFAHNSEKVNEIAKRCETFVRNFKVVKAVGTCDDQKIEIINSCDILITTPPAFIRLTSNICLKIIDVNRFKHVAFDAFHLISSKYEKDINRIMKFCLADNEKVPHVILTSGICTSYVKQKFINQLLHEKTAMCFDSFIDAAVCAEMEIKLKICESIDEKVEKLLRAENLKDAVVIINDEDVGKLKGISSSYKERFSVLTDSTLEISNIKNVKNLIHLSTAKNWKTFTNRLGLMYESINDKLNGHDVKLETTVLFREQDISEYEALITFMIDRKLCNNGIQKIIEVKLHLNF